MYLFQRNSSDISHNELVVIIFIVVAVYMIFIYEHHKFKTLGSNEYVIYLAKRIRWFMNLFSPNQKTKTVISATKKEISDSCRIFRVENVPVNEKGDCINIVIKLTILDNSESSEK